jgi:Predicted flavoprotein involved in K+ transport
MTKCDVAIIGAGPYGLSAAAHLRAIKGLDVHVFGHPMSFWKHHMPAGMWLRSPWACSHISDPDQALTLAAFQTATSNPFSSPIPLNCFVDYGLWYQRQVVPDLDQRKITRVSFQENCFSLVTETGDTLLAHRLVVAAGIATFASRPPEFAGLPTSLASHTSEHSDFPGFRRKRVLVLGSGQSAMESAALLDESGAEVEIISRSPQIRWLGGKVSRTLKGLGAISRMLYAPTDVGPAGVSQIVARPDLIRRLPGPIREWMKKRSTRPAGARWLIARLHNVPMKLGRSVVSAVPAGERVRVKLDDGSVRDVDHVFLGTGYRVDISKYGFLAPELSKAIRQCQGYPRLGEGFETSVPRLHFLGAPAIWNFGPIMQFLVGTHYASRALFRHVARKATDSKMRATERPIGELAQTCH